MKSSSPGFPIMMIYLRSMQFSKAIGELRKRRKSLASKKLQRFRNFQALINFLYQLDMEGDFDLDFFKLDGLVQMVGQWAIAVADMRAKLVEARAKAGTIYSTNFITLRVNLPDGVGFQYTDSPTQQKTNQNQRILTYNISVNNLNPDPAYFEISQKEIQDGKQILRQRPVKFTPTYQRAFDISNFVGVMIAEQIRFSTLRDCMEISQYEIKNVAKNWNAQSNYFYDNFKIKVYNNWKHSGTELVKVKLTNGNTVKVQKIVEWKSGP